MAKAAKKKPAKSKKSDNNEPDMLQAVVARNYFYRDNYWRILLVTVLLLAVIGGLVAFIFYQRATRPTPKYFATTPSGELLELIPLNEPNLSTNTLLQWATQAATSSYTFNFVNYREALQNSRQYFTTDGYNNFLKALESSRNLEAVKTKKLVVSSVPTGVPIVVNEGQLAGRYAWQVEIPMLIAYQSATEVIRQNILLTMLITRISTLDSPKGIGISQFIVETTR